jgi:A/G-specific adenine glycosylase
MLQQTTVAAVIPYYSRFLEAFPDVSSLARAPEELVLRQWSGLGYYRRARNLQTAARSIVAAGGEFPGTARELERLPGIGAYTAAAIASIAFGEAVPVVDGNVMRVVARLHAMRGNPNSAKGKRMIAESVGEMLDPDRPGDSNQALMELGATICTPRSPNCAACPWSQSCAAHRSGKELSYPELPPRPAPIEVHAVAVRVLDRSRRILLVQIPAGEVNGGQWELPTAEIARGEHAVLLGSPPAPWSSDERRRRARVALERRWRLRFELADAIASVRHTITRHRITVTLFDAQFASGAVCDSSPSGSESNTRWSTIDRLADLPLTTMTRKLLSRLASAGSIQPRVKRVNTGSIARPRS